MNTPIVYRLLVVSVLSSAAVGPVRAQWAVIDAPAIVQLVQEVQTMQQQLQATRDQLTQARQALQTTTGDRGMELLLGGTSRNYLPTRWSQLTSAVQGGAANPSALGSDVRSAVDMNALLSPAQLSSLPLGSQQRIIAGRQSSALQQALAEEALENASGRFASLQHLVDAIAVAGDQKAVLDLQARIGAEVGMLQNEQTKLQILRDATQAQAAVNLQQEREQIIAGHGSFPDRFRPVP